ncbi:MAG: DUF378 domain-containing protein [Candidatus Paceibacterota bacterium]
MCTTCKECKTGSKFCFAVLTKTLVIIGGLNWGLVGAGMLSGSTANVNLVNALFGSIPAVEATIYLVVGIAAFASIFRCKCKKCKGSTCCSTCDMSKQDKKEEPKTM